MCKEHFNHLNYIIVSVEVAFGTTVVRLNQSQLREDSSFGLLVQDYTENL